MIPGKFCLPEKKIQENDILNIVIYFAEHCFIYRMFVCKLAVHKFHSFFFVFHKISTNNNRS